MIAEDLCTQQLGYRNELDAREAERREIDQSRVTSLDRTMGRANTEESSGVKAWFTFRPALAVAQQDQVRHLEARLIFLEKMGLGTQAEPGTWNLRSDFLTVGLRRCSRLATGRGCSLLIRRLYRTTTAAARRN